MKPAGKRPQQPGPFTQFGDACVVVAFFSVAMAIAGIMFLFCDMPRELRRMRQEARTGKRYA